MADTAQAPAYSLHSRLLLTFSVVLCLFLGLTGMVLDRAFRTSVEAGVAEQLQVQVYVLLAAFEEDNGRFYFGPNIREPRFSQLNSGLYGFVSSPREGELLRSLSALEQDFARLDPGHVLSRGETRFQRIERDGEEYFVSSYGVVWENRDTPFVFSVFETTETFVEEVVRFRASLWSWLGGAVALLLLIQLLLLRWALAPLRRLADDLKRIESGDGEQLEESYPRELGAVTDNLNLLLQTERKQQQRYRTTLGDLAHSLKTPLAVIQGNLHDLEAELPASSRESLDQVDEQLQRMNQIVRYQLQRAVRSDVVSPTALARRVHIATVVERILSALGKVYANKGLDIEQELDDSAYFLGDERDLMEVLGNVLDNACKYGNGRLRIEGRFSASGSRQFSIVIEDDGPGISGEHREWVLQRGARLDTLPRGQGIGLAVVADIVNSYGGQIEVDNSPRGGARVEVVFSNVKRGAGR